MKNSDIADVLGADGRAEVLRIFKNKVKNCHPSRADSFVRDVNHAAVVYKFLYEAESTLAHRSKLAGELKKIRELANELNVFIERVLNPPNSDPVLKESDRMVGVFLQRELNKNGPALPEYREQLAMLEDAAARAEAAARTKGGGIKAVALPRLYVDLHAIVKKHDEFSARGKFEILGTLAIEIFRALGHEIPDHAHRQAKYFLEIGEQEEKEAKHRFDMQQIQQ